MEAEKMFPPGTLDPDVAPEYCRRAARLQPLPRTEVRLLDEREWFCRGFFFGEGEQADMVLSVSGVQGVVATEIKMFPQGGQEGPTRETRRLSPEEGAVFRDMLERNSPWTVECPPDLTGSPIAILECINPQGYAVIVLEEPSPGCPEHEIATALARLWPEVAVRMLERMGE